MMVDRMPSNALDYITIHGFKSIASIEKLPLKPINVLIGANGSGKSNFIGAFDFLHEIREGRLLDYVRVAGGAEKVLHFGSKVTKEIHLDLLFSKGRAKLKLRPNVADVLYVHEEEAKWGESTHEDNGRVCETEDEIATWDEANKSLLDRLLGWRIYHFQDTSFSSAMRKTANVDDNRFLRPDGSNLPAFLYLLREKHPDSYRLIRRIVELAAPFFGDFELQPQLLNLESIKMEWRHKRSDQYFDASSLSDGTLRFIALATLFLQPEQYRPSLILVDEPELGLHPYALELLASLIRQASIAAQIIVSTQSATLLDHFDPENVLVAERVDGGTRITRLNPERLDHWLEDYSLGQLWEKNEFGGRPTPA